MSDWRPERRVRDPDLLRILKLRWDCCCLCGGVYDLHLHHILYRSHCGDDAEGNCCCLCSYCHSLIHARDPGAWTALAEHVRDERSDTLIYLEQKLGSERMSSFFEPRLPSLHPSG